MDQSNNLWGGRFSGKADEGFEEFNRSFGFDRRLFAADILASIAHCEGLHGAGVLDAEEVGHITSALSAIVDRAASDPKYFDELPSEDIHSFIEARLVELIGDTGRKLHTGRSRNDQVATALRLWLRDEVEAIALLLRDMQQALIDLAEKHISAALPGYTHLQRAQPILWAHWCLAYFEMFVRDSERLVEAQRRINIMPLGSAALAGTSHSIDRESVAHVLGFEGISRNSLDAVSDRDFCLEFASVASIIMMHLSRLADDIIIYSTAEFGFIELSDAVATGSSLMPQKKNPDSMELVRGKSGRVFGNMMSLLTMMKGLPLAYNKDMQEDKEAVFDTVDTVKGSLKVAATVLRNLRLNEEKSLHAASRGYMNATELADYLARKGMPFRDAHATVGRVVLHAIERELELEELALDEMQSFSALIGDDVYAALSIEQTLASKYQAGGTSRQRVSEALAAAQKRMKLAWFTEPANPQSQSDKS